MAQTFSITPQGPFSLTEAALFGFGQRSDTQWDGVMRLAFCLDGYTTRWAWSCAKTMSALCTGSPRVRAT